MTDVLQDEVGMYLASFVIAVISGVFPLVNGELYLIGVVLVVDSWPRALGLAIIVAIGQTIAHVSLFYAARGVTTLGARRRAWFEDRIARARLVVERWRGKVKLVLLAAATIGVPPMLVVSPGAGALGVRAAVFAPIALVGRLVRFVALALAAQLV